MAQILGRTRLGVPAPGRFAIKGRAWLSEPSCPGTLAAVSKDKRPFLAHHSNCPAITPEQSNGKTSSKAAHVETGQEMAPPARIIASINSGGLSFVKAFPTWSAASGLPKKCLSQVHRQKVP
ncbi:uncharacterized protein LOC144101787 [Amblyomma americanum]